MTSCPLSLKAILAHNSLQRDIGKDVCKDLLEERENRRKRRREKEGESVCARKRERD
jgi:hypothetical protein